MRKNLSIGTKVLLNQGRYYVGIDLKKNVRSWIKSLMNSLKMKSWRRISSSPEVLVILVIGSESVLLKYSPDFLE